MKPWGPMLGSLHQRLFHTCFLFSLLYHSFNKANANPKHVLSLSWINCHCGLQHKFDEQHLPWHHSASEQGLTFGCPQVWEETQMLLTCRCRNSKSIYNIYIYRNRRTCLPRFILVGAGTGARFHFIFEIFFIDDAHIWCWYGSVPFQIPQMVCWQKLAFPGNLLYPKLYIPTDRMPQKDQKESLNYDSPQSPVSTIDFFIVMIN